MLFNMKTLQRNLLITYAEMHGSIYPRSTSFAGQLTLESAKKHKNTIPSTNQLTSPCNTDITANAEMRSCPDKLDVANVRDRKPR